jgi:hypothetical protein
MLAVCFFVVVAFVMLPTSFDRGRIVYDAVTPLIVERMEELHPRDMVITCRGASGCGEHALHMSSAAPWCSEKAMRMLRTYIYNEIVVYMVPARFDGAQERTAIVLPNLWLRVCAVEQSSLDRHKKVLQGGLAPGNDAVGCTKLCSGRTAFRPQGNEASSRPGGAPSRIISSGPQVEGRA